MTELSPAQAARVNGFAGECERLRPLGEAYVMRRFSGRLNHADAEDAVSEVLIRLHRRAERGETPENLRAAFFTSVRNAAIDQLRARGARPTTGLDAALELPADGAAPAEYAEGREEGAVLAEALATMRRNYREAILLRFGVGLTIPEIAERREISVEAAKKLVLRGTRQVKERLLDVTSELHCEEMQGLAKRQLFEKYAADLATEEEVAQLEKHLEHCGRCKSLVVNFHHRLHELASGALVSTAVGNQLTDKAGVADHISGWITHASDTSHAAVEKARLASFKVGNALQGGEAASGGVLAGTGQKIAAVCAAGATATCVGAGVVGPGVGVDVVKGEDKPAIDRPADATPIDEPAKPVDPAPEPKPTPVEQPTPTPAPQAAEEFAPQPSSSAGSGGGEFGAASGGGGGSGGGGEGFGFEK